MERAKEWKASHGSFDASRKNPLDGPEKMGVGMSMGSMPEGTSVRLAVRQGNANEKAKEMTDPNLDETLAHANRLSTAGSTENVRAMGESSQNNKAETARKYPAVTTFPPPGTVSQQPLPPLTSRNLALQSSGYRTGDNSFGYISGSVDGTNVRSYMGRPTFTSSAIHRYDYSPPPNPFSNSSITPHYPITNQPTFSLPNADNKPPISTTQTAAASEQMNEPEGWEIITSSDEDELKTGELKDWDFCIDAEINLRDLKLDRMGLGGKGKGKKYFGVR